MSPFFIVALLSTLSFTFLRRLHHTKLDTLLKTVRIISHTIRTLGYLISIFYPVVTMSRRSFRYPRKRRF